MNKLFFSACLLCGALNLSAQSAADIHIIPAPAQLTTAAGSFAFSPSATKVAAKGNGAGEVMQFFCNKIHTATGQTPANGKINAEGTVSFIIDASVKGSEAYTLEVTPKRIVARASTSHGLFYAMQSLLQLMPASVESSVAKPTKEWSIPAVSIADAPRFPYRGVMLDPCRHFLPVDAVKKHIDLLSSYKINRLHWHLTEDQGWRVEIKKYPELTAIGGQRVEGDGTIHKGFYTQEEVKEVVEYARQRHVDVIPELEIPGHELAAISAFPQLSCKEEPTTPRIIWGVEDIVMCPGKELMFNFLQDVIDELTPLFPSKYFHIGGDESPRMEWKDCARCQARMKEQGYTDEAQLQSYVIGRIEKYLRGKGKVIIGWDEILEGGNLDTTAVVMSWRGEDGGITAAKAGHHVLMTPSSHGFYFDQFQGDAATEPSCAIGGYSTLEKVYSYNPVPAEVHAAGRDEMVLGVQANCWSEYLPTPEILEYRLYPRALALAEVGWSQMERKNFKDFQRRVDGDASERLELRHVNYHIPMPEQPGGSLDFMAFVDTDTLSLKTTRPLPIIYTTNGTNPTAQSARYTKPIVVTQSTVVKAATILPNGIVSPIRTIYLDKSAPLPATNAGSTKPGLLLNKWEGFHQRPGRIQGEPSVKDSVVSEIESLRTLAKVPASVRNVKDYAATVEGYISIPETGVYEFSTNNDQLFIDGILTVDNSLTAVPRHSPKNRQLVLAKGLHRVKVVFYGGIYDGWPTYWDDAKVNFRPEGGKWQAVSKEMLSH